MGILTRVVKTAGWVIYDNLEEILNMTLVPKVSGVLTGQVEKKLGQASSKWLFAKLLSNKAVDGAILNGFNLFNNSGWKGAIRHGLPSEDGVRRLAIENEPHVLDGFDGTITKGYGKGTKRIVYKGKAILKVMGKTSVTDIEYHEHIADRAGLHYDIAIRGLPEHTDLFELNVGKGPVKGRYSFVATERGYIVGRMKDRGITLPKPTYNPKQEFFLQKISDNPELGANYIVERKYDGSLGNALIRDDRAVIHSHRDGVLSYYDKLPSIEFLQNTSKYFLYKNLFRSPNLDGTVLKVELVHPNGSSVVSGILNSSADNAVKVQSKIGPVNAYVWDIVKLRGKDVSNKPYEVRRALLEECVRDIRLFNRNWQVAERAASGRSPIAFYRDVINDSRGLPYSEGVVVKHKQSTIEDSWYKTKLFDLVDMEVIEFLPAKEGSKHDSKLGSIIAKDLKTGNIATVGTGYSDFEREWIWNHRHLLNGSVIKAKVFEVTDNSARAPRFVEFHESKGNNEYGLLMYADVLSGLDDEKEMLRVKHAMINS